MNRRSLFGVVLFLWAGSLFAADIVVDNVSFSPQDFSVGDRVTMTVRMIVSDVPEWELPDLPLETDGYLVESLEIRPREGFYEAVIGFRSFVPGSGAFPPLSLGPGRLEGLTIFTVPLVDKAVEPRSLRPQLFLPGTRLYTGILVLLVLGSPFIVFHLVRILIRLFRRFFRRYRQKKPYRRFIRVIRKLETGSHQWDTKAFFIVLIEGFKAYLTEKSGMDFNTATTGEIRKRVIPFLSGGEFQDLLTLLQKGDLVKFAGESLATEEREQVLGQILQLADNLEHREDFGADL